jgi:hypothetical protein
MLQEGKVASATIVGMTVTMTLKDGQNFVTEQPAAGEFRKAIESCGAPCADVQVFE